MKTRIGIFTTNSIEKIHPRIEMQISILRDEGYDVEIIRSETRREGAVYEFLNLLSLKYFKKRSINKFKTKLNNFDVIHIYDLQLLPLAKQAKRFNKKVIYETLDDNVYLHFHALSLRIPFIKVFENRILNHYLKFERSYAAKYCDSVIVNSPNLLKSFNKATLIYYASNLEGIRTKEYDSSKATRFIYIGKLSEGKGSKEYQKLIDDFSIPMIFIGKSSDSHAQLLQNHEDVDYRGNFDSKGLKQELNSLILEYNLIGLSIIIPENKSYELQEANKDIDYLCLQIPFIGNKRKPTYEKIKEGAGVLFSNKEDIQKLILNEDNIYNKFRDNEEEIYVKYSKVNFKKKFIEVIKSCLN